MGIAKRFLLVSGLFGVSGALLLGQYGSHGGAHSGAVSAPRVTAPTVYSARTFVPTTAPTYPSASAYSSAPNPAYRTSNYGPFRAPVRRGRYNGVLPYGYLAAPFYPLWDYSADYGYSGYPAYSAGYDQPAPPPEDNALGDQIAQLSAQLNDLQNQLGQRASSEPAAAAQEIPQPPSPPLTVVLTNGKTLQVQNYAVMENALWDLSSQPVRKIPISTIDVPASTKATEANGTEFPNLSSAKSPTE